MLPKPRPKRTAENFRASKSRITRVGRDELIAPKQCDHCRRRKKNAERHKRWIEFGARSPRTHVADGIYDSEKHHGPDECANEDCHQCAVWSDSGADHCHQCHVTKAHRFFLHRELPKPASDCDRSCTYACAK